MKRCILLVVSCFLMFLPHMVSAQEQQATLSLTVTNTVSGNQGSTTPFTFQIDGKDNAPMPEMNQITINGSGKSSFGRMIYDNVGTYYYTVQRLNNGLQDYSDDTSIYTVQVIVTYRLDNPDQLIATAIAYKSSEDAKEDLTFQTAYTGKPSETTPPTSSGDKVTITSSQKGWKHFLPKTGQAKSILTIVGFLLIVLAVVGLICYRRRQTKD